VENTLKELQKSKVEKKADAEQEQKVSAADQLYREQVDEYNVRFELLLLVYMFLFLCYCFRDRHQISCIKGAMIFLWSLVVNKERMR